MAIDIIQLPNDGVGKKIAARSYTENSNTVYAQAGFLTTDTAGGNPAAVQNSSPSNEYGLVVRNIPSGTQNVSQLAAGSATATLQAAQAGNANGSTLNVLGMSTAAWTVNMAAFTGTVNFEGSEDGTNYTALTVTQLGTSGIGTVTAGATTTSIAVFECAVGGLQLIRARTSGVSAGTVTITAHAVPVTFAPRNVNASQAGTWTIVGTGTFATQVTTINGQAPAFGTGTRSASVQRVTIATDDVVPASQSGTWNIGTVTTLPALPANQSTNISQINAVTPLMGNGVTGTGSQRVTIASDNTAFSVNAVQSGTWTVQPGNTANTTAWKVDGSAVTQPVSGTVTANQGGTWTVGITNDPTLVDNAGFTDGTTRVEMAGYIFDEVAGTSLTENDAAAARIDSKRAIVHVIEDATTRGRRATVTAGGAILIDGSATTQPVSGTVSANATLSAETTKIIGTVNVAAAQTIATTNAGTFATQVTTINGQAPAFGSGARGAAVQRVTIATDDVVPAAQSGTWTVQPGNTANTTAWKVDASSVAVPVTDNAGSLTVDSPGVPTALGQSTMANSMRVAVASDQSSLPVIGGQGALASASWTSATSGNTALTATVTNYSTVTVGMHNTSTMTGGVLTFEVSPDNTNWFPIAMGRIDSFTAETTYTLNTVADRAWATTVDGFTNFRVRLSTVITGSGTATIYIAAQAMAIENVITVGQASAASLNATVVQSGTFNDNITQFGGTNVSTGTGASGAGIPRVTVANDSNVLATQSGTWTVQPGNTANSTAWLTSPRPATTGGLTTYHLVSAASTNATVVKASAGQLYGWFIYNGNAATRYLKFHNASTTPTAGASIFFVLAIPAFGAANVFGEMGISFSTGISITTVTGAADNDTVAVSLNDLNINLFYA